MELMIEFPEPPVPFDLPYPGERLKWAIDVVGWNHNYFADRMGLDRGSMRQMFRGSRFIPDVLGLWMETLAQFHLTFPKPLGWTVGYGEDPGRYGAGPPTPIHEDDYNGLDNELDNGTV